MRLSIITVNRNNAAGLRKTMDSVVYQSFTDFEYIIIDGASTDTSIEVMMSYAMNAVAAGLQRISEPDGGIYQAMNKGINLATGEYLLFLNSGDYLVDEDVLDNVFAQQHEADMILGKCRLSQSGVVVHTTSLPEEFTLGYLFSAGIPHQATFIRRTLFEKYGQYDESFRYNADIAFWYQTLILGDASLATTSTIVADYNIEGISSLESETAAYRKEIKQIFDQPRLRRLLPDYASWKQERKDMEIMRWAKERKPIYALLVKLHAAAVWYVKIRSKK